MRYCVILFLVYCLLSMVTYSAPSSSQPEKPPKAVWGTYGLLINDSIGNAVQQNPQIIGDGLGNYIIVWEDGRNGYYDLYAQKVTEAGKTLWSKNGIPVCRYPGNQNAPQVVSDGAGGAVVVWQDYRFENADIFAQRIGPNGELYWSESGTAVCAAPFGQFAPTLISDNNGGAFIAWHDYRNKQGEDIYVQRISGDGAPLFVKDGLPICLTAGTQWYPKIAPDGQNGAVIVWTDGRNGPLDNNIFAQRVSPAGKLLWEADGISVCSVGGNQERPNIAAAAGGLIIVWDDSRAGNSDLFVQKIKLDGSLGWSSEGVPVCQAANSQAESSLADDGQGGAVIAWSDERGGDNNLYVQNINSEGIAAWGENGRFICRAEGGQKVPKITKLTSGDFFIVWEDERAGQADLYAQKINSSGTALWEKNGIVFASARLAQEAPALAAGAAGSCLVAFQDFRSGNTDIYCQKINPAGTTAWGKDALKIGSAIGSVIQQNIKLIENGLGEIILIFEDARSGFLNIYAQKINRAGNLAWGSEGLPVAPVAANQTNPVIISDGKGGAYVAWEDYRAPAFPSIRVQHLSAGGQKTWKESLAAANLKSRQINPSMVSDGVGGAILAWQDDREAINMQDIIGQRLAANGKRLWGNNGKAVVAEAGDQVDMDLISDGAGGAFLTWTDYRNGERNPDIFAQRINNDGDPLWVEDGVLVCGAPDIQRTPKVVRDDEGGILVAWTDKGGGSYDIYAQRLSKDGKTMWMTDGIPINQLSRTQQNPQFGNANTLIWEDYRLGNWDIFAGKVQANGRLAWGDEGKSIVTLPHTQYAPQITAWKDNGYIITWEDYRGGQQYEIFIQKIDHNGSPAWEENGIKVESRDGARAAKIISSPSTNSFFIFWEDHTGGGRAIYGQKYLID
ncbi:MAG: hypothetical protein QME05_05580 [Candidatus Margulisbacteria bacterium]|nr:hypothetical protein [Candidatus Margulisiibacteriota bacterium]